MTTRWEDLSADERAAFAADHPLDWHYVRHVIGSLALALTDGHLDWDTMADLATMLLLNPDIHWSPDWKAEFDAEWQARLLRGEASTPDSRAARAYAEAQLAVLDRLGGTQFAGAR